MSGLILKLAQTKGIKDLFIFYIYESMRTILILIVFLIVTINVSLAQEFRKISKSELISILENPTDILHVINFWATWCGPCVKELPDFQQVIQETDKSKVDFLFVSLDFPSDADKKLGPFLKKNNYTFDVALMTETDYNSWIDLVDPSWQGSLPATLFFNKAKQIHRFIPEPLEKSKLIDTINSLLIN